MAEDVADATFLFHRRLGPLPVDLSCRKWWPPPVGNGRGAINNSWERDLWRYHLNKNGPKEPAKVGSTVKYGFMRAHVYLWELDRLLWILHVEV